MTPAQGKTITCSRGHTYQKTRERPVCPDCWPGYYRSAPDKDLPALAAPALRALLAAGITGLDELSRHAEGQIQELHGMGPSAMKKLRAAMKAHGLSFKT